MMNKAYREFDFDWSLLSEGEKQVVEKLIQAAEKIGPLYLRQENNDYLGANFYPHDAKKQEIKRAAEKNPAILSPFTVIERDSSGNLKSSFYHQKYEADLEPIAKLLQEAAEITQDSNFSAYLKARAKALLTDDYEESTKLWLDMPESKLDLTIGPIERYIDKLFFVKTAYQATVHVKDEKTSKKAQRVRDICFATKRSSFNGIRRVSPTVKGVQIRADFSPCFAGFKARHLPTATHLPNETEYLDRYGSKLALFLSTMHLQFEKINLAIFESIFEEQFRRRYQKEVLFRGRLLASLLHEISHQLNKYENSEKRLQDLFPVFDELNAHVTGIKYCRQLFLKGAVSQVEFEALLIMHICFMFAYSILAKKQPTRTSYAKGASVAIDYYFATGALKEKKGISWPNFTKMFFAIENLSEILVNILSTGSYKEAERFLNEYCLPAALTRFEERLKSVPTEF